MPVDRTPDAARMPGGISPPRSGRWRLPLTTDSLEGCANVAPMTPLRARTPDPVFWAGVLLVLLSGASVSVAATGERPFDAESPTLLPAGAVEVEAAATGAVATARVLYPEDEGDLVVLPILGVRAGLGPWGEVRVEGDAWQRFRSGGTATGPGDWTLATKIRFGTAPRPLRFAALARVKVPVASDNEGLGTNLADIDLVAVAGIHTSAVEVDLDLGAAILDAPFRERAQIDVFTYAACLRRKFSPGLEAGIEIAGRGAGDFFPARSVARGGIRWDRRHVRWDAAVGFGLARGSPNLEVRAGATFRFGPQPAPAAPAAGQGSGGWTPLRNGP